MHKESVLYGPIMSLLTCHCFWSPILAINNLEELNLAISLGFDSSNPFGPIELWDVSNCDSFFQAFKDATTFNEDISGWDVSSATSLQVSAALAINAT